MIHINATITFDKSADSESLQVVKESLFTYNLMAIQLGSMPIPSEICDCGETVELRFDFDYVPDEINTNKIFDFLSQ